MDPITAIAAVNAALSLIEVLTPKIEEWVKSGEVSAEEQAQQVARLESLRARKGGEFDGPEWEGSGVTAAPPAEG